MPIKNLSVVITGNATGLTAALKAASAQLTAFDRQVTAASAVAGRLSTASSGTSAAVTRLGPAAASAAASVTRLGTASGTAAGTIGRLSTAAAAAATNLGRLGAGANTAAGALGRLNGTSTAAAASQTRLGAASAAAAASTARLGAAGAAGAAAAGRLGTGAAGATGAVGRLGASSGSTSGAVSRLGQAAGAAGGSAGQLGRGAAQGSLAVTALASSARTAATGGVLVLGVAFAAAVAGAVSFEAKMRNVASIDATVEQNFDAVSRSVLNLSKHMPQSAATLAEGLYNIAGSGFYGADAMHILEVSATAASAGLTNTNTASKAIVASLNAYGLEASEAGRVSDALFSTVNYGVISFEALTAAVAHTVGNAAQAGIEIEEVGAALATMTLSGLSASNAGVSLNNMISKLIKPSKALSAATQELGINLAEDLKNPAIGLHGVMEQLRVASEGNLQTLLRWFPEIRAARGAMALMAKDGDLYAEVFRKMGTEQKTAGETARVFAVQAQSAKHQLEILGNQIAVTGIELGMQMLPYLEQAIAGLTSFGGTVKDLAGDLAGAVAPGVGALRDAFLSVAEIAGDMNLDDVAAGLAGLGVSAVVTGFNALAAVLGTTTGFLADHTVVVKALVAAWLLFNSTAIIRGIQLIGVTIASTLVNALVAGIAAIDTMIARMTVLGGGTLWRGMAASAAAYGAGLAVVAAAVVPIYTELTRVAAAQKAIKANQVKIEDILGSAPGGIQNDIAKIVEEVDKVGPASKTSFGAAQAELKGMAAEAQASLDAINASMDNNFWNKDFWKDAWKIWERPGQEAKKYEQILADLGVAQEELDGRQTLYQGNLDKLATQFGMTELAVARVANEYGINLVQGLDAAGASGETVREQFKTLATDLLGADASAAQIEAGMAALDSAIGGGEAALKELNLQLDIFMGKGVATSAAIDQVELGFLDLAEGAGLAEGGLLGYDRAAIQNRATITEQIGAIRTAAQAYADQSGKVDEARTMYDGYIERLKTGLVEQGRTREEVEALFEQFGALGSLGPIDLSVSAPGAVDATAQVETLDEVIRGVPHDWATSILTPGAAESAAQAEAVELAVRAVPEYWSTVMSMPGAVQATGEVNALNESVGRLPFNWEIPVATPGAMQATGEVTGLDEAVRRLLPKWDTLINTPGAVQSELDVSSLDAALKLLPPDVASNITTPGATVSARDIYALKSAIDQIDRDVQVRVRVYQDTSAAGAALGAAAATSGRSITKRAAGGPIVGPGSGTSDDVPIMASDGEWVIRESAASRYGPDAMAAVNAGRARIIVPDGYAAGGPVRASRARTTAPAGSGGASAGSGTTSAIAQIASGAASLADVYQATTQGVIGTARALREVVPRMWRADQQSSSLAASTGTADGQMGRWRDTIVDTAGRVDLHRDGLFGLGVQMTDMATRAYPTITTAVQTQTAAQAEETVAQTLHQEGLLLLGTTMDTASGVQLPALTESTDLQTTATDLLTAAVDLGTQAYTLATEATGVDTDARDIWTTATDLGTAATDLLTAAVDLATAATGEQTTATGQQTTATNTQTTATNTANTATTTFTGTVNTNSTALNQNAASATAAAAAVRDYVAAVNSVPANKTTTITTNYVTTGAPAGGQGFAGGGRIAGPGTRTSDSIPAMLSRDEYVIRAAAANRYGYAAMDAINSGTARVLVGSASAAGYATGGRVGHYAAGGMVRGSATPVGGGGSSVVVNAPITLTIKGGDTSAQTVAAAQQVVDRAMGQLARRIGARPGRGRG